MLDAAQLVAWVQRLQCVDPQASDAERIEQVAALESLKCAAAGAQAELAVDFDASQRAEQAAAGVRKERLGAGVAAQVGLARRESHHRGRRFLGLVRVLRAELPCTWAALRGGWVSEWRATIVVRETACLSREDRAIIDRELSGDPQALSRMGEVELAAAARKRAYELDAEAFTARARKAEADRRVTSRPAPDTMCQVTGLLPVAQGVAVMAALTAATNALVAAGDGRTRGQIMADTLVERVTGIASGRPVQDPTAWSSTTGSAGSPGSTGSTGSTRPATPAAADEDPPAVAVRVNVVLSDRTLLGLSEDAAQVEGYGPVPGDVARRMVLRAHGQGLAELRRLFANPRSGALVAMESRTRGFRDGLAALVRLRDRTCRTPWCDAQIRHVDHPEPVVGDGRTSVVNGQGLCEACNYAKEALGWAARPRPGPRHSVETITPTGHRYTSTAPRAPVHREPPGGPVRLSASPIELRLADTLAG